MMDQAEQEAAASEARTGPVRLSRVEPAKARKAFRWLLNALAGLILFLLASGAMQFPQALPGTALASLAMGGLAAFWLWRQIHPAPDDAWVEYAPEGLSWGAAGGDSEFAPWSDVRLIRSASMTRICLEMADGSVKTLHCGIVASKARSAFNGWVAWLRIPGVRRSAQTLRLSSALAWLAVGGTVPVLVLFALSHGQTPLSWGGAAASILNGAWLIRRAAREWGMAKGFAKIGVLRPVAAYHVMSPEASPFQERTVWSPHSGVTEIDIYRQILRTQSGWLMQACLVNLVLTAASPAAGAAAAAFLGLALAWGFIAAVLPKLPHGPVSAIITEGARTSLILKHGEELAARGGVTLAAKSDDRTILASSLRYELDGWDGTRPA